MNMQVGINNKAQILSIDPNEKAVGLLQEKGLLGSKAVEIIKIDNMDQVQAVKNNCQLYRAVLSPIAKMSAYASCALGFAYVGNFAFFSQIDNALHFTNFFSKSIMKPIVNSVFNIIPRASLLGFGSTAALTGLAVPVLLLTAITDIYVLAFLPIDITNHLLSKSESWKTLDQEEKYVLNTSDKPVNIYEIEQKLIAQEAS